MNLITFLSDFGQKDWFVGSVKGEILKHNSAARIIDITHDITPHDIRSAAFVVRSYCMNFPSGTVHLAVVDPGVGSTRKPIIVRSHGYFFVGPDNGIFSYIYTDRSEVFEITSSTPQSSTFHARDIFGPAAALLAQGKDAQAFGPRIDGYERITFPEIVREGERIRGEIVYIDRFGNCITNIPQDIEVRDVRIQGHHVPVKDCYAQGHKGELIAVRGSRGFYEIVVNQGSACALLDTAIGAAISAR